MLFRQTTVALVILAGLAFLSPRSVLAAPEPTDQDLATAIQAGDFAAYQAKVSAWLNEKVPADPGQITVESTENLFKDGKFVRTLDQRQLLSKFGVEKVDAFAKGGAANQEFLTWLLTSAERMDLFLEAVTPSRDKLRAANEYSLNIDILERWRKLYVDDPDSRAGIYLKLAMATAIWPPGGTSYGSGKPIDPFRRYEHYKAAHRNHELVASFDTLTVGDYGKVIGSNASDEELAWGRQMINTWRPDLREGEQIPKIVSEVWRRFSPFPFSNGYPTVMEGGGKCGPRAFFGGFICQAWGIPMIGVGQPAHACFAAKSAYPDLEPQPGSVWKVYQGRGWHVSDCGDAMYGPEFLAEMTLRYRVREFSRAEHLRWLASALTSPERADAVRSLVDKIRVPVNTSDPLGVPARAIDAYAETGPPGPPPSPPTVAEAPFPVVPGVIHVEAETFVASSAEATYPAEQEGKVFVYDCATGGKQVNFQKNMNSSWIDYEIDTPEAGTYALEIMVAAANRDQVLNVSRGEEKLGTIQIAGTIGLWQKMAPVDIRLEKGKQTLRISAPMQRGVAIRWFELTAKKNNGP